MLGDQLTVLELWAHQQQEANTIAQRSGLDEQEVQEIIEWGQNAGLINTNQKGPHALWAKSEMEPPLEHKGTATQREERQREHRMARRQARQRLHDMVAHETGKELRDEPDDPTIAE